MKKNTRGWVMIFSVLMLLSSILPAYADELEDKQQSLQNLNQQIQQQQNNVNNAKKQEKSVIGQIQSLEQNIVSTQSEIDDINNRVGYLEKNIGQTQQDIDAKQKELNKKTDVLGKRLTFIYEQGQDVSYLEVLLSATDIQDFLTRYDMLNSIVGADVDLIESVNREKRDLDLKKSDLEAQKNELESLQRDRQGKKVALDSQKNDKENILKNVKQEKEAYTQALNELEQESKRLEAMIRQIQGGSSGAQLGTGVFTWPAPGYKTITDSYGMRYHPILKTRRMHTGEDIAAPSGSDILAADGGTVIDAGWMGAYGQAVIIDHGQGLSTLYGHMSKILVSKGESVSRGQVIGKVGSTGLSTGPHLHFEVRVNGTPTDPTAYVQ